ncbi:hypothetical protein H6800_01760 [Candidatus Nomurabacteria bacterium]|nr:hypothetical protein [Candidatus Nomurabacteria bacterium]
MLVLTPISKDDLLKLLDPKAREVIRYFIKKSLFSQPEPLPEQISRAVQIPKEHIEQWFVQALDVKPIGAGSYPVDIYNEEEGWAADIKMLNAKLNDAGELTNSQSGEASLGQKFIGAGIDLDSLFANKQHEEIKDAWLGIFANKIALVKRERNSINDINYFFILRAGFNFYLVGCSVEETEVKNVTVKNATKESVFLDNFIDDRYGNAKIYKAKKRLELRLRPKNWVEDNLAVLIETDFNQNHIRLYDEKLDDKFLQEQFDRVNSLKINIL